MQCERRLALKLYTYMAAITFVAKVMAVLLSKWQARNNGHTMIAFLAKFSDVGVTQLVQRFGRKLPLWAFGFLQT